MFSKFSFNLCDYPKISKRDFFKARTINIKDKFLQYSPFSTKLQKELPNPLKIGMAVLAYERPQYLKICLDSLFRTRLYDYNITFLIQDDGSLDPQVKDIIETQRDPEYQIIRYYTPKGPYCAGAAINKAIRKLLEIDDFNIIGWCDPDALFHPDWLDQTLKICLWAKAHHKKHILGPFSSFNSSDFKYHIVLGKYPSPYGDYVVKRQMGMLNYFYFKEDFQKLGFFPETKNDETLMTEKFARLGVRNFCTDTSYIEHIGHFSVLNEERPTPVYNPVYGLNLVKKGWPGDLEKCGTMGYYRYVKGSPSSGENISSNLKIDIVIPCTEKDSTVLPYTIGYLQKNLRHPLNEIFIVSPKSEKIKDISDRLGCTYIQEDTVLPVTRKDIPYIVNGVDRSGWLFQQLLKLAGDSIVSQEFFYVIDADTILIRPQVFELNEKTVFLHSDEYHRPYYEVYRDLLGCYPSTNLSFVAHQMMFQRSKLSELRNLIEKRNDGETWFNVIINTIDKREPSSFSEYELYGHWMMDNYLNDIEREYWFNCHLPIRRIKEIEKLSSELKDQYRSISFHRYN